MVARAGSAARGLARTFALALLVSATLAPLSPLPSLARAEAGAGAEDPPAVTATRPRHGDTAVDPSSTVQVTFSEPMDRASAEAAFTLNPAANGSFRWAGETMLYVSDYGFQPGTWYGAAVAATARSASGETLPEPAFFGFLTAPRSAAAFLLTGRVTLDGGAPVVGSSVEATLESSGTRAALTYTDHLGGFALSLAAGDEYRLRVAGEGHEPYELGSVAGPGDHRIVLRPWGAPPPHPATGLGLALAGIAAGGAVVGSFVLVDALRFAFFSVGASMMFRLRRENVLDNFVRGQVFGAIVLRPGITYTEIRRRLRIANGQLAYHLHVLLKEEFVVSRRVGAHACFFPSGVPVDIGAGMRLSPLQESIVGLLRRSPGISQTEIAARLDRPVKTIHYNVSRLQAQGALRVERAGKRTSCFAVEETTAAARRVDIAPG